MRRATTAIPEADLADEIWTVEHLGTYLHLRKSAAHSRAQAAGFPSPCDGDERYRRWRAAAVRSFHEAAADQPAPRTAPAPRTTSRVTFRPRKTKP